ncbi:MAG: MFS transporter, partial [Beijerinckiaceae bacterium]|nr:MFS transporter [Beijerinckiaceae bacterium]
MTPGGRLAAAIEILADIEARHRPAPDALKDWGLSHRFAGSKDRAAIAALVFDTLRRRASATWIMGADTPRARALGALRVARGMDAEAIAALCTGEGHAPAVLDDAERQALEAGSLADAPAHVQGDFPEWLAGPLAAVFGDALVAEMQAMAERAPLDLRVNTLKASRDKALSALAHLDAAPAALAADGRRRRAAAAA